MDKCVDSLEDAAISLTLDASWNYLQIPIANKNKKKPTVASHAGTYWLNCMAFCLVYVPATFQRYLDIMLNRFAWKTCLVHFNNVIIF